MLGQRKQWVEKLGAWTSSCEESGDQGGESHTEGRGFKVELCYSSPNLHFWVLREEEPEMSSPMPEERSIGASSPGSRLGGGVLRAQKPSSEGAGGWRPGFLDPEGERAWIPGSKGGRGWRSELLGLE